MGSECSEPDTSSPTEVTIDRVDTGFGYVRVNTIGNHGERPFVLVPGIGVSSTYFERLAPNLNEFGPVHALDLPGFGGGPVVNPAERSVGRQALRLLQAAWHEPLTVKLLTAGSYVACGVRWFSRILPKMMRFRIERALPHVSASTLVIRGEFDAVCPRDWVRRVGDLLPYSRLWEMPGAAHTVMYGHAEEVAVLCVEHARQAMADPHDDRLRHYDIRADAVPDTNPTARPIELFHAARSDSRAPGHAAPG